MSNMLDQYVWFYRAANCSISEKEGKMTPNEFKHIRTAASLTQEGLAQLLRLSDSRSIRRYEDGSRTISGPISLLMELLRDGKIGG